MDYGLSMDYGLNMDYGLSMDYGLIIDYGLWIGYGLMDYGFCLCFQIQSIIHKLWIIWIGNPLIHNP